MFQSETTNTLPILNFTREYSWNPIEAWLLGASPVISGDTPASNVIHTYNQYLRAHNFQGQWPPASIGQSCTDQNGRKVPCPSEQDNTKPSVGTIPDNSGDWKEEEVWIDKDGNIVAPNTPGATKNTMRVRGAGVVDSLLSNSDNWFKRITLVAVGIVIIAIAIASLR